MLNFQGFNIGENQNELRNQFRNFSKNKKAECVYSENFGLIDRTHIVGSATNYYIAYNAVDKAIGSHGMLQTIELHNGDYKCTYVIYQQRPRSGESRQDAAMRITRGILCHFGVSYEKCTTLGSETYNLNKVLGGVGPLNEIGQSAFSTEDLPSNALGMEAVEAWIKSGRTGTLSKEFVVERVLDNAGMLYSSDSKNVIPPKRESYGNQTFNPKYGIGSTNTFRSAPPHFNQFFKEMEAERLRQASTHPSSLEHAETNLWRVSLETDKIPFLINKGINFLKEKLPIG